MPKNLFAFCTKVCYDIDKGLEQHPLEHPIPLPDPHRCLRKGSEPDIVPPKWQRLDRRRKAGESKRE